MTSIQFPGQGASSPWTEAVINEWKEDCASELHTGWDSFGPEMTLPAHLLLAKANHVVRSTFEPHGLGDLSDSRGFQRQGLKITY